MRINAILTWTALVATWAWLAVAYIDAQIAKGLVLEVIQHLHGKLQ